MYVYSSSLKISFKIILKFKKKLRKIRIISNQKLRKFENEGTVQDQQLVNKNKEYKIIKLFRQIVRTDENKGKNKVQEINRFVVYF